MRIRYFFLIAVSGLFFTDCRQEQPADDYTVLEGQTMGTYYRITYQDEKDRDFQSALDSLFVRINLQVSTYIDSSVISRFNRSADGLDLGPADAEANDHFLVNLALAREVYERSGGAFDPTVMPLVNYWGFGYTGKDPIRSVDSLKVDSLLEFVGFGKVELISGITGCSSRSNRRVRNSISAPAPKVMRWMKPAGFSKNTASATTWSTSAVKREAAARTPKAPPGTSGSTNPWKARP